jgi:hypothetical protein
LLRFYIENVGFPFILPQIERLEKGKIFANERGDITALLYRQIYFSTLLNIGLIKYI